MRTIKTPTYLTKFPISISQKQHNELNPRTGETIYYKSEPCHDFITKYGYFDVDKGGNITFIITLVSIKNEISYTIKIAKQHIYDSLMINLMYKPIARRPERTKNFYVHKSIEGLIDLKEEEHLLPNEIVKKFIQAKEGLEEYVTEVKEEVLLDRAHRQLEELIRQQWKLELIHNIRLSEKIIKEKRGGV